ncbi:hypothetical protein SAMN05443661_102214 [Natronobacterium gregoryi]|uniref:Uncharacterized protein n=2 Tax=Natronobacterium gregoryi TaxID=44930 RepID=L0AIQ1_NATGS|nr:hypothetical protein Natgr_1867 [Natronobacterium gregoryi SP2]SFI62526.1 hypothetical protein SAMN05443661_102214 [Natronobacterium gregoryi]
MIGLIESAMVLYAFLAVMLVIVLVIFSPFLEIDLK